MSDEILSFTFYHLLRSNAEIIPIDTLLSKLPSKTVLLEYAFLGDDFLAWAITADGIAASHYAQVDAKALERQIHAFQTACASGQYISDAEILSERFLLPFAHVLDAVEHLIIVGHGAAHTLPFAALPFNSRPLIRTKSIAYLPNASIMQYLPSAHHLVEGTLSLVVGNPTLDLSAAAVEACRVAETLKADLLLEDAAVKDDIVRRIGHYRLFHFATHSILREDSPLTSAIALANGEEITVYELMSLKLDAQLVVLSSCDSARGEITRGDDLVGLTRGLFAAGAESVVASLWEVGDQATSLLMTKFYENALLGMPLFQALAHAQKWLATATRDALCDAFTETRNFKQARHLKENYQPQDMPYSHPYFWAAFTYHGL